jgi:hypothetical protein
LLLQGNPCGVDDAGNGLIGRVRLRFSQLRTTKRVQQVAPRKITGARNVTRKPARSNETIELSQSTRRIRFSVCPESNRVCTLATRSIFVRACARRHVKKELGQKRTWLKNEKARQAGL